VQQRTQDPALSLPCIRDIFPSRKRPYPCSICSNDASGVFGELSAYELVSVSSTDVTVLVISIVPLVALSRGKESRGGGDGVGLDWLGVRDVVMTPPIVDTAPRGDARGGDGACSFLRAAACDVRKRCASYRVSSRSSWIETETTETER